MHSLEAGLNIGADFAALLFGQGIASAALQPFEAFASLAGRELLVF